MRIKTAYQIVMFDETIRACWEGAGFQLTITDGEVSNYEFREEFKAKPIFGPCAVIGAF